MRFGKFDFLIMIRCREDLLILEVEDMNPTGLPQFFQSLRTSASLKQLKFLELDNLAQIDTSYQHAEPIKTTNKMSSSFDLERGF